MFNENKIRNLVKNEKVWMVIFKNNMVIGGL